MNQTRSKYQVHAELIETGNALASFDDVVAGHPTERRLNRMERVVVAYRGQIEARTSSVLLITFETAEAALLAACEMQHRCAVLPQVSANRLALRIGIHQGVMHQRATESADNTREIAALLATVDDGIVASESVIATIKPELRQLIHPLDGVGKDVKAYTINWRCEIPSTAFGGESLWPASKTHRPAGPYLLLHHGLKTIELSQNNRVITVGREPHNDLVIVNDHASRNQCRIEIQANCVVLIDSSTNGTCITPDEGKEILVRHNSVVLKGSGLLFFGRMCNGERRGGVRYEAY